ncbi:MAG: sugar ABC transporter permease [Streptosporangiales bacterium]|nr:sugar ABC transporter permease [Streptosporangiales bacterium]
MTETTETTERPAEQAPGVARSLPKYTGRLRGGELGALPVVVGLVLIGIVFQSLNENFLTPQNLTNLALQSAAIGTISVGIVLVLLLGEIDLSVGWVSGLTGAVLAVLNVQQGWPAPLAIGAAIVGGAVIGCLQGVIFAKVGVPAFVVTLAGFIGWQGLQLRILGETGTINFSFTSFVAELSLKKLPPALGWVLVAAIVLVYLGASLAGRRRRAAAGLPESGVLGPAIRAAALAAALVAVVSVFNAVEFNPGIPVIVLIFVAFVVVFDLVLRKTRYGRMIFAVGGNAEAARRAGINVVMVRISVFTLAGTMAAAGGVLFASRLFAVNQNSGGSDTLLMAIAAVVIGGTSLFGGRGSAYSALLGTLVIGAITSGMLLLSVGSDVRFMVTAAVLLTAVVIDSLSHRGRRSSARGG